MLSAQLRRAFQREGATFGEAFARSFYTDRSCLDDSGIHMIYERRLWDEWVDLVAQHVFVRCMFRRGYGVQRVVIGRCVLCVCIAPFFHGLQSRVHIREIFSIHAFT